MSDRANVKYKDHVWNDRPDGSAVCALCGEQRGRENPAGQWWCWDNTFDLEQGPE